jgi:deoxyribodipyrimidine photo-lyase
LAAMTSSAPRADTKASQEELIVRREPSDNFCHFNPRYDSVEGFPAWAKAILCQHLRDRREHVYGEEGLERAGTPAPIRNAAQRQMVKEGKMHGWLRMYWAKRLLEWTETLRPVIALNDEYEMDGRDPNGHVQAAWSIGGVQDRAWSERPHLRQGPPHELERRQEEVRRGPVHTQYQQRSRSIVRPLIGSTVRSGQSSANSAG